MSGFWNYVEFVYSNTKLGWEQAREISIDQYNQGVDKYELVDFLNAKSDLEQARKISFDKYNLASNS